MILLIPKPLPLQDLTTRPYVGAPYYYHLGLDIEDLVQTARDHRCFNTNFFTDSDEQRAIDNAFSEMKQEARKKYRDTFRVFTKLASLKRVAAICLDTLSWIDTSSFTTTDRQHFDRTYHALLSIIQYQIQDDEFDERHALCKFNESFSQLYTNFSDIGDPKLRSLLSEISKRIKKPIHKLTPAPELFTSALATSRKPKHKDAAITSERFDELTFEELTLYDDLEKLDKFLGNGIPFYRIKTPVEEKKYRTFLIDTKNYYVKRELMMI